jgi:hypothetical protein
MRIVAADPGGTTGVAVYDSAVGQESFQSFELPTWEAVHALDRMLDRLHTPLAEWVDLLVCESFIISEGTLKKTRAGSYAALESIGALRYLAQKHIIPFELQEPVAKGIATTERLKILGWHRPSKGGHQNDAARHLLVAAIRYKVIDPKMFLEADR